jgi:hypothetical protein
MPVIGKQDHATMTPLPLGSLATLAVVALTLIGFAFGETSVTEAPLPQEVGPAAGDDPRLAGEADAKVMVRFVEFEGGLPPMLQEYFGPKTGVMPTEKAEGVFKTVEWVRVAKIGNPQAMRLRFGHVETVESAVSMSESREKSAVKITVGGREQEFGVRHVGVAMKLTLLDGRKDGVAIKAVIEHTSFTGFVEYGGTRAEVSSNGEGQQVKKEIKVPSGFYQPIFETTSHDVTLVLTAGQTVFLRFDSPAPGQMPDVLEGSMARAFRSSVQAKTVLVFVSAGDALRMPKGQEISVPRTSSTVPRPPEL